MRIVIDSHIPYIKGIPESLGLEACYLPAADINAAAVSTADALIVRTRTRCDRSLLADSRVQLVVTATIGFDHLDTAWLDSAGISWTNCPGCNASAVGQYVQAGLLALAEKGRLNLTQATVGIVGVGHVGTQVRRHVEDIGCRVLLNDPPRADRGEAGFVSLERIASSCDVVTFHVPLADGGKYCTRHLASAHFFAALRRQPIIINSSRGGVVDEEALLAALDKGLAGGAIIDTWENEPNINRRLLDRALIATPHIAGYSAEGKANATRMAMTAVCRHFGIEPHFSIELPPVNAQGLSPDKGKRALQLYDPMRDSRILKQSPDRFEWLRSHYPLRRESAD